MQHSGLSVLSPPDEQQIRELVDSFYSRVRHDELLGPVFADAIGQDWEEHLGKMTDFWSTVVLASRRYKGNPMLAHIALPRLRHEHFERWLTYWKATATEVLGEGQAEVFVKKAEFMAERLLFAIDAYHGSAASAASSITEQN
jgi:hemoglobin